MRISFWQLRHPWRHGKLSIPLASVLFHSIYPLSLNLLISTSLPYFVREAISEIYMKRQFPSSFLSLHSLTLHWDQTDLKNGIWGTNEIRSASFGMLFFGRKWLVSLFTRFRVTNGQEVAKITPALVCSPYLTEGWEHRLAVSSETAAPLWCIGVNIFLTFLRTDFHHWIHLYFWGYVINESGHSFSSPRLSPL